MSDANFDDFLAAPLSTPSRSAAAAGSPPSSQPRTAATTTARRIEGDEDPQDDSSADHHPLASLNSHSPQTRPAASTGAKQPPPAAPPTTTQRPPVQQPSHSAPSPLAATTPSSQGSSSAQESSGSFVAVARNNAAQSASTTIAPPFVFKVAQAVMGQETIKPITYFPIQLTVSTEFQRNQTAGVAGAESLLNASYPLTLPLPLPTAPQQRHVPQVAGQRRCRWDADAVTHTERRYSELNDLRRLLVLQYPMRVIPPLISKSSADNLNTYMQSQAHLRQQQRNMHRFLRELAKMPEIMLFHDVVPGFFLFPREKFVPWMQKTRDMIALLQGANASIEEHRATVALSPVAAGGANGTGLASDAAAAVTAAAVEGTKMIKNVAAAFSAWYSGTPTGSSSSSASSGRTAEQRAAFQQKILAVYHRSSDVALWSDYERRALERRVQLVECADFYMRYIAASDEVLNAIRDVAGALGDFHNVLQTAEGAFQLCSKAAATEQDLFLGIASSHEDEPDKKYVHVYEALLFEASFLEAVEDAAQFVKCLLYRRYELESDPFATPSDVSEWQKYTQFVHENLKKDMEAKMAAHVGRLRLLVQKDKDASLAALAKEDESMGRSAFLKLIRDPEYSRFV